MKNGLGGGVIVPPSAVADGSCGEGIAAAEVNWAPSGGRTGVESNLLKLLGRGGLSVQSKAILDKITRTGGKIAGAQQRSISQLYEKSTLNLALRIPPPTHCSLNTPPFPLDAGFVCHY
ncbi:hypothetical protein SKAU_G00126460 [Synaphobranchus kaupii]|uniref:Uncharacterized protein n=1 Tax=Synaphobranchus kaupii TaxID=118154 RepID=A0A9Q1J312_SYNKA|nr:hypothetical protein SKAU_G00126460 [Synaphobranchus kaupii]